MRAFGEKGGDSGGAEQGGREVGEVGSIRRSGPPVVTRDGSFQDDRQSLTVLSASFLGARAARRGSQGREDDTRFRAATRSGSGTLRSVTSIFTSRSLRRLSSVSEMATGVLGLRTRPAVME